MGRYIQLKNIRYFIMKTPTFDASEFNNIYETDSDNDFFFLDQLRKKTEEIYNKIGTFSQWLLKWSGTIVYQVLSHLIFVGLPFLITIGLQQLDDLRREDTLKIARQQMQKETMKQMNSVRPIKAKKI